MGDTATPQGPRPLELERVQSSRAEAGELHLRLSGRWLGERIELGADEELLVVNVEGRRHRFPASRDDQFDGESAPGRWSASFKIPTWAEPREDGQAALWLGNAVIPVPPLEQSREATAVRPPVRRGPSGAQAGLLRRVQPAPDPPPDERAGPAPVAPSAGAAEPPRSGPLADLLLRDTVGALQDELEQRTADAVQSRAALANAQSELEARSSQDDQLESTLAELRGELDALRDAVQDQRRQLRERSAEVTELRDRVGAAEAAAELRSAEASALRGDLAAASVSRDAAISEAAGLRSELDRVGSELAVTREQVDVEAGHLDEASRLLADARALAEELRADEPIR
jgi:hypothetical protein